MADTIQQTLGFDVSQSLEALAQLDQSFAKMQSGLQGSIRNLDAFNQMGGKTVAALIQIKSAANDAADALTRLNSIKPPPTTPGGGLPQLAGTGDGLAGQQAAQAMAQLLGQTAGAANAAAPALNNAGQAASAAGSSFANASGRTSGFAISLETLGRVIGTQVIVRGLSAFRTAVEGSFQGFIDFNRKIAEIQTISPEPLNALAKGVRELSDQFNAPLLDVAKAKYQILSNGFQDAADSAKILTASLKFAKVGISDTTQAADLITAALNAYGKGASEAEIISAKLFKTIELGRVIGSELANSFARVAPIAKEVGASEDEILAGFSSITQGGVKASEAATQLRATLSALLKPSKDMEAAFQALGAQSGEQVIRAKGFQGALLALIGTTDGSATAIKNLFPNVRALNGVLRETTTGVDIFKDHLKQIQDAGTALLNRKFEVRVESNAEKVAADLNRLKNFFTVDLGSSLVSKASTFTALIGGVNTLKTGLDALVPVIGAVVTALTLYSAGSLVAEARANILSLALNKQATAAGLAKGAITGLIAAIAAAQFGTFIGNSINRFIDAPVIAAKKAAEDQRNFEQEQSDARVQIASAEADEKARLIHNTALEAGRAAVAQTEALKEGNTQITADNKATLDKIIAARQKFANDLKRAAIQADNDITESHKRANDLQGQLDDRRFSRSISQLGSFTQSSRESIRALQLANEAAAKLAKASTPEEKESAQNEFNRAQAFAQEAIQSAKTSGNIVAQAQAERTLEAILQRRIAAERAFQAERKADADRIAKAAADEEKRVTDLQQLAKAFLEKTNFFDKNHQPLATDQIKKNLADAGPILAEFREKAFGKGAKFNLQDLFSFDKLEARLNQSFTAVEVKNLFASPQTLDKLFNDTQNVFKTRNVLVNLLVDKSKAAGKNNEELLQEVREQATAQQEKVKSLAAADGQRVQAQKDLAAGVADENKSYLQQQNLLGRIVQSWSTITTSQAAAAKEFEATRKEINDLANDPKTTAEQINNLQQRLTQLQPKLPGQAAGLAQQVQKEFDLLTQVFQARQKIDNLDKNGQTPEALKAAQKLSDALESQRAAAQAAEALVKGEKQAISDAVQPANDVAQAFTNGVTPSAQIRANMEATAKSAAAAAASSRQISSGGSAAQEEGDALGGFIQRFATGGFAKGTDSIPAVLSPRESVINSRQSERFHPQIVAMNAGITPSFSQTTNRGGDVNINGDININEAKNGKASANQLIDLIRRAQRRGAGSSFSSG